MRTFWLSFWDTDRPVGSQLLGGAVVEVETDTAEAMRTELLERDGRATDEGCWIAAALRTAHAAGCNPGGEVACGEIPPEHPDLALFPRNVLLSRDEIIRLDALAEGQPA